MALSVSYVCVIVCIGFPKEVIGPRKLEVGLRIVRDSIGSFQKRYFDFSVRLKYLVH